MKDNPTFYAMDMRRLRFHEEFDPKKHSSTINFQYYVLDTKRNRILDMFSERRRLRVYMLQEMKKLLKSNGWLPETFYNKSMRRASAQDLRLLCVSKPAS